MIIEDDFEGNETYDNITITKKDIASNEDYFNEWGNLYDYYPYPFVAIKSGANETIIGEMDITVEYVGNVIAAYLEGEKPNETSLIYLVFHFQSLRLFLAAWIVLIHVHFLF
jgi:hypothetical protein